MSCNFLILNLMFCGRFYLGHSSEPRLPKTPCLGLLSFQSWPGVTMVHAEHVLT